MVTAPVNELIGKFSDRKMPSMRNEITGVSMKLMIHWMILTGLSISPVIAHDCTKERRTLSDKHLTEKRQLNDRHKTESRALHDKHESEKTALNQGKSDLKMRRELEDRQLTEKRNLKDKHRNEKRALKDSQVRASQELKTNCTRSSGNQK